MGIAAMLLAAGALAAPAAAAWTSPFALSPTSGPSSTVPRVATAANGPTVFAWQTDSLQDANVQARARSAAGTLGAIQNITQVGGGAVGPSVAVDNSGDAVFAWARYTGLYQVQARTRSSAGALGAIQAISAANAVIPNVQVAVDSDGDEVFAWLASDGSKTRVYARARSSAGTVSPIRVISPAGQNAFDHQLAIDDSGNAVLAWNRYDGTANFRVEVRARSAAGVLSPVQRASPAGRDGFDPRLAVDPSGDAVIAWRGFDGTNARIQTRARSAAGALSPLRYVSPAGVNAGSPEVAVDATNDAVFAWTRFVGTDQRVQARVRTAAGALSGLQLLSAAGRSASDPQVAVDNTGDAVFTWHRSDGSVNRVQARTRSTAAVLGAIRTLSAGGQTASEADVAVDASGDAVVAWKRGSTATRVQGAAGP